MASTLSRIFWTMNLIDGNQEFNSEHFGQDLVQIGPEMAEKSGVQKTSKIGICGPMVFASLDNNSIILKCYDVLNRYMYAFLYAENLLYKYKVGFTCLSQNVK